MCKTMIYYDEEHRHGSHNFKIPFPFHLFLLFLANVGKKSDKTKVFYAFCVKDLEILFIFYNFA